MAPLITILTDFGDQEPYVAIMKGVIARIAPQARTVDLTHNIPPGNIQAAALALLQAVPFFPEGAVHLVVVDPGVGSRRRPIAAAIGEALFVGPDNGVFTHLYQRLGLKKVVELAEPRYRLPVVSHTFHGRDIFSPAAAHLANGVPLEAFGPAVADPERIALPRLAETGPGVIGGEVIHADRFGNLATSIAWLDWVGPDALSLTPWLPMPLERLGFVASRARITVTPSASAPTQFDGIRRTFSDMERGELGVIIGSERHLDIVVNRGSAQERLGARPGDPVELRLPAAPKPV